MSSIHVELLLGRRVHDVNGHLAGRIFEIHAVRRGAFCFVDEYILGRAGLLSRLGMTSSLLFGLHSKRKPTTVPWELMDLSDPQRPTLKVALEELRARNERQSPS